MSFNDYTPVAFEHVSDVSLTERDHSEFSHSPSERHDRQEFIDVYPDKFEAFASTYDGLMYAVQNGSPDTALDALNMFDSELRRRPDAAQQLDDEIIIQAGQGNPEIHLDRIKQRIEFVFEMMVGSRSVNRIEPVQLAWDLHVPTADEDIPEFEANRAYAYLRDLEATRAPPHTGEYGNDLEQAVQDQLSQLGYPLGNRWFSFSTTDPSDSGNRELDVNTTFNGEKVILEVFTGSDHLKDRQVRDYTRLYAMADDDGIRPHALHVTDTKPTTIPIEVLQLLLNERPNNRPAQIGQRDSNPSLTPSLITRDENRRGGLAHVIELFNDAGIHPEWKSLDMDQDGTTASYPVARVEFVDTTVHLGFRDDIGTEQSTENHSGISLEGGDTFYWVTITNTNYERGETIATIHPDVLLALLYLGKPFEAIRLGEIESSRQELIGRNIAYERGEGNLIEAEVLDVYSEGRTRLWIELNINGLGTRVDASGDAIEQCTARPNSWAESGRYTQLYIRNPNTDPEAPNR